MPMYLMPKNWNAKHNKKINKNLSLRFRTAVKASMVSALTSSREKFSFSSDIRINRSTNDNSADPSVNFCDIIISIIFPENFRQFSNIFG